MDSTKLAIFLRSVDLGSFSRAAAEMGYTPSGVSQLIGALEREIGFPLLLRDKRGVRPTPDAQTLIPLFRDLLSREQSMEQVIADIKGLAVGEVRVGAYPSIAEHWMPRVIKAFEADYPNIEINLFEGVHQELDDLLAEQRVDFCLYSQTSGAAHEYIPLKDDPMFAVLPVDHPLANATVFPLSACGDEPFIMPSRGNDYDVMQLLREENIVPNIKFSTIESYAVLSMIECGIGICIMNELATKGRINQVAMVPLSPPRHITMGVAVPSLKKVSPAARKLIDYIRRIVPTL